MKSHVQVVRISHGGMHRTFSMGTPLNFMHLLQQKLIITPSIRQSQDVVFSFLKNKATVNINVSSKQSPWITIGQWETLPHAGD